MLTATINNEVELINNELLGGKGRYFFLSFVDSEVKMEFLRYWVKRNEVQLVNFLKPLNSAGFKKLIYTFSSDPHSQKLLLLHPFSHFSPIQLYKDTLQSIPKTIWIIDELDYYDDSYFWVDKLIIAEANGKIDSCTPDF